MVNIYITFWQSFDFYVFEEESGGNNPVNSAGKIDLEENKIRDSELRKAIAEKYQNKKPRWRSENSFPTMEIRLIVKQCAIYNNGIQIKWQKSPNTIILLHLFNHFIINK